MAIELTKTEGLDVRLLREEEDYTGFLGAGVFGDIDNITEEAALEIIKNSEHHPLALDGAANSIYADLMICLEDALNQLEDENSNGRHLNKDIRSSGILMSTLSKAGFADAYSVMQKYNDLGTLHEEVYKFAESKAAERLAEMELCKAIYVNYGSRLRDGNYLYFNQLYLIDGGKTKEDVIREIERDLKKSANFKLVKAEECYAYSVSF